MKAMTALSDEELVNRYREAGGPPQGTPFADELFQRHYNRVALWCFRISGDRDQATDLAQEVFSRAWTNLDNFRAESKFSTWLYMIARNHCFNSIKTRARVAEDAIDGDHLDLFSSTLAGFDTALERAQMVEVARELMAKELTPVESQIMTLHYAEDLPLDSIARLLKLDNPSGAKAYIVSAKRKLKAAVDRWVRRGSPGGPRHEGTSREGRERLS